VGYLFALGLYALGQAGAALVPATEYEAEDQKTSGSQIGPDRTLGTVAAEASGRRAILLNDGLQSIQIDLKSSARGLTIRYAFPESDERREQSSTVVIDADGREIATALLTSRYLQPYRTYPSAPDGAAAPPRYWDEVRVLLSKPLQSGTRLTIHPRVGGTGFAVDVIDAELVARPRAKPPSALSLREFGADPSGQRSSRAAFLRAIAAARQSGKPLYVGPGQYKVDGHLIVDRVTISGAGPWYTVIRGHHFGLYSRPAGSSGVSLSGLAVESDVTERRDQLPLAAIGGRYSRSEFMDLFLHHAKVGIWLDGPAHDLAIRNVRIADQAADGINLHRGISRAVVENNHIRNSGDDGIASWSDELANSDILIRANRVIAPRLANGIALYGGRNIEVSNNFVADTLTEGGGLHLGTRFHSAPFGGWIRIANNTVVRAASIDPHWHFGVGAIWIYALERPISAEIMIYDDAIVDAGCEAVQLLGPQRIDGVRISGLKIGGSFSSIFALQTHGSLHAESIEAEAPTSSLTVEVPPNFQLVRGAGNSGWTMRPAPRPKPPTCR
jgi:Alpha-1,3-glucanase catalytic domain D1/Alpha-1,3-glucanase catalytic domain D2